jgi:hypothetical protein
MYTTEAFRHYRGFVPFILYALKVTGLDDFHNLIPAMGGENGKEYREK